MNIDVLVHFGICVCKYKLFFVIVHVHGKKYFQINVAGKVIRFQEQSGIRLCRQMERWP